MYTGSFRGFESRCPAYGPLAQLVERLFCTQEVAGSIPVRSTEHGSASCFRGVRPVWRLLRWRGVTLFGLRASRWACYYVSIVPSRPPGLAGCIVPVVELVDTPDLGSGVLRGVWVRLPPGALAAEVFGVSSCRSRSPHAIVLVSAVRRVSSIWQNTSLVNWSCGFESPIRLWF